MRIHGDRRKPALIVSYGDDGPSVTAREVTAGRDRIVLRVSLLNAIGILRVSYIAPLTAFDRSSAPVIGYHGRVCHELSAKPAFRKFPPHVASENGFLAVWWAK
ncbi:hypothetical protein EVAR_32685_1 [Eumeta japonica]|uniref:Uncharacterized protein n=1 Tax=Eumeta variegata TaxID=151549 RepID=A0A4C1VQH4_EUMVA|nr:hypothetical protein EVAR_32685_1 [Eumeta japonica]